MPGGHACPGGICAQGHACMPGGVHYLPTATVAGCKKGCGYCLGLSVPCTIAKRSVLRRYITSAQ